MQYPAHFHNIEDSVTHIDCKNMRNGAVITLQGKDMIINTQLRHTELRIVGEVRFGSGSGYFCPNAEPEPRVRFKELSNLNLNLAFGFSAFGSAFEQVRAPNRTSLTAKNYMGARIQKENSIERGGGFRYGFGVNVVEKSYCGGTAQTAIRFWGAPDIEAGEIVGPDLNKLELYRQTKLLTVFTKPGSYGATVHEMGWRSRQLTAGLGGGTAKGYARMLDTVTSEIAAKFPTTRPGFGVRTRSAKSWISLNLNLQLRFRFGNSSDLNPELGVQFGSVQPLAVNFTSSTLTLLPSAQGRLPAERRSLSCTKTIHDKHCVQGPSRQPICRDASAGRSRKAWQAVARWLAMVWRGGARRPSISTALKFNP
ncbi:hypothetical protein B0H13DRAFT_1884420 [Mycena leptocephala]|nr:hypothetical protein B0H13DRAFT_1884420 [Mycena leptocephala]